MKLLKFGGSSVSTSERINEIIKILATSYKKTNYALVFSAFGGITDKLIEAGKLASVGDENYLEILKEVENRHLNTTKELLNVKKQSSVLAQVKMTLNELDDVLSGVFLVKELTPKTLDFIISFGERLSCFIITEALNQANINSTYVDARNLIYTDSKFGNAKVDFEITNKKIQFHFKTSTNLQVITGFIGSTLNGETTTLGRGGSDYTVAIIGAALNVKEIEIWTDVNGVLTADPRKVKHAFSIDEISYEEAMELSHFGAKVIYPPTIQPALNKNIPIRIKNTFNPKFNGTLIIDKVKNRNPLMLITGVSSIDNIALLRLSGSGMIGIKGTSMRLFAALAHQNINVILITQASSEHTICFAVSNAESKLAKAIIEEEFSMERKTKLIDEVIIESDLSIIAIVGENMKKHTGISARLFHAIGVNGINVVAIAQGSSELNISVVIPNKDLSKALNSIHESFFLSDKKTLNLFVVGIGLVGKTLMEQIKNQHSYLSKHKNLELRLIGVSNSKKMLFNEDGIDIKNYLSELNNSSSKASIKTFRKTMLDLNMRNSVFIDNTSNSDVASEYESILKANISVVTPNKIACSGKYETYLNLKNTAQNKGIKFLFETNVGAGLPVLSTLNDLINSGDEILKIEGVLSGSLSFIFDAIMDDMLFSDAVQKAVEIGYAEPDPRLDLEGTDVARKILILTREAGYKLNLSDVNAENMVPVACRKINEIPTLFKELKKHDKEFVSLVDRAKKSSCKLKYIAKYEKGKASASLQMIDNSHPFFGLSGNENVVSFTTKRYDKRPLIVRGPGAGAEVTAAGVFADIIRISNL